MNPNPLQDLARRVCDEAAITRNFNVPEWQRLIVRAAELEKPMNAVSDNQLAFNVAFAGLKAQGFMPAYDAERGGCQYRTTTGLKCAVGHLIADEHYDPHFDLCNGDTGILARADILEVVQRQFPNVDLELLGRMQDFHDLQRTPEELKAAMIALAHEHGLEVHDV